MKSMRQSIKSDSRLPFEFIEAACCGMAGSYGLEAEHTQQSRGDGRARLITALDAEPDAVLVCNVSPVVIR